MPTPGRVQTRAAVGKYAIALAAVEGGTQLFGRAKSMWRDRLSWTVTLTENDPIYSDVHSWLLTLLPQQSHRALMVGSNRRESNYATPYPESTTAPAPPPLRLTFNETRERRVRIDGELTLVRLQRADRGTKVDRDFYEPDSIVFTCFTKAGQAAVIKHIERIHDARREVHTPVLRMVGQYGGWRERRDLPDRTLPSVALPHEQKRRVVEDLRAFLDAEATYNRLAIPWHRGYMFHGPPGSGKTSLVKALASEFNLDLWYISLSDLKAEAGLMGLLAEVSPRSMLLLEDIDTVRITTDRDASTQGTISMSSLLNALDGVATPHGLVTVMTTNHFERLDPALTRAGRMDVVERVDFPTWTEVEDLFRHFYGLTHRFELDARPPSMAEVAETFKRNLDAPGSAAAALTKGAVNA